MQTYAFNTSGVCSRQIVFSLDQGKVHDVRFSGGCPGNTSAIGKLLEGMEAERVVDILKGNRCGNRTTSCADQLAIAVELALKTAAA